MCEHHLIHFDYEIVCDRCGEVFPSDLYISNHKNENLVHGEDREKKEILGNCLTRTLRLLPYQTQTLRTACFLHRDTISKKWFRLTLYDKIVFSTSLLYYRINYYVFDLEIKMNLTEIQRDHLEYWIIKLMKKVPPRTPYKFIVGMAMILYQHQYQTIDESFYELIGLEGRKGDLYHRLHNIGYNIHQTKIEFIQVLLSQFRFEPELLKRIKYHIKVFCNFYRLGGKKISIMVGAAIVIAQSELKTKLYSQEKISTKFHICPNSLTQTINEVYPISTRKFHITNGGELKQLKSQQLHGEIMLGQNPPREYSPSEIVIRQK